MKDYYKCLQIDKAATDAEIKKAFRKLAKKYHPDANPNNKAAEVIFKEANEAYATLSDETKRADYDRRMFGNGQGSDFNNVNAADQGAAYQPRRNMSEAYFAGASNAFENFFGFDPKSSNPTLNKDDKTVRPMKTNEAFEAIFGKKRF